MKKVTIEVCVRRNRLTAAKAQATKYDLRRLLDAAYPNQIKHVAVTKGGTAYIEVSHEVAHGVVARVQSQEGITVGGQRLNYLEDYASAGHRTIWEPRAGHHEEPDRQALVARLQEIKDLFGRRLHQHIGVQDRVNADKLRFGTQVRIKKDRVGGPSEWFNRRKRRRGGTRTDYEKLIGFVVHTTPKQVLVLTGKIFSQHALDADNGIALANLHVLSKDNHLVEPVG
jgi:hypothetical protein